MSRKRRNNKLNKKKTGIIAVLALICLVGIYTFNFSTRSEVIAKQGINFKEFDSELLIRDEIEINKDDGGVYIIFPEKINGYYVQQYFVDDESIAPTVEDNTNTINENVVNEVSNSVDTNTVANTTEPTNTLVENTVANIVSKNTNTVLENTVTNTTNSNTVTNTTSPKTDNTIIDTLKSENTTISNVVAGETKTHETSLEVSDDEKTEEVNTENNSLVENDEVLVEENSSTNTTVEESTTNTVSNNQTNTTTENTVKPAETVKSEPKKEEVKQEVKEEVKEEPKQENTTEESVGETLPTKEISNIIPFDETKKENDADIEIPGKNSHKPGDKLYIDQGKIDNDEFSIEVKFKMVEINGRRLYSQDLLYESALVKILVSGYIPSGFNLDVQAESIEKIEEMKADVAELADSTVLGAYNIKIVKDNEEYQPVNYFQAVNVSITSPEQFSNNLMNNPINIIHIKEDNEKNEIVFEKILLANKTDDTVECRTNEFSTYAILKGDTFTEDKVTIYNYDTEYDYYIGRDYTDNGGVAQGKYNDNTLAKVNLEYYSYDTARGLESNDQLTEADMVTYTGSASQNGEPDIATDTAYSRYLRRYNPSITIRRNAGTINAASTWTMSFRVPKEIDVSRVVSDNTSLGVSNATFELIEGSTTEGTLTITGNRFGWQSSGGGRPTYTANLVLYLDLKKEGLSTTYNDIRINGINNLNLQVSYGDETYDNSNSNINSNLGNYTDDSAKDIQVYTRYIQSYLLDFTVESKADHYIDINKNWNMSFSLPNNFVSTNFNNNNSTLNFSSADFSAGGEGEEGTLSLSGNAFKDSWRKNNVSNYSMQIRADFNLLGENELVEVAGFVPMSAPSLGNKKITTLDRVLVGYISHVEGNGSDNKGERQNCITYTTCVPIIGGQASIELIDNPFMDRPADFGFNGWKIKSDGTSSQLSNNSISLNGDTFVQTLNINGISHTAGSEYTIVLEADWQPASVVFVGGTGASDSNDGLTPETSVSTIDMGYRKLASNAKTATNASNRELNIMVLVGGNHTSMPTSATIPSRPGNNYLWQFENISGNQYRIKNVATNSYLRIVTTDNWPNPSNTRSLSNLANATTFTVAQSGSYYTISFTNTYDTWWGTDTYNGYLTLNGASGNSTQLALLQVDNLVPSSINTTDRFVISDGNLNNGIYGNGNTVYAQGLPAITVATPYTITSLYNKQDYRNNASLSVASFPFPFDMQFDFLKMGSSGTYEQVKEPDYAGNVYNVTYLNGHNIRFGRGMTLPNDREVTIEDIACGVNGTSSVKNKVVVESGRYNTITEGRRDYNQVHLSINNTLVLGNDIDRAKNDDESMKVYHRISSRTGRGNSAPADSTLPMFKIVVKSGTHGVEAFENLIESDNEYAYSGIYIGGLTYANNDTGDRLLFVEGGKIANIIGGLAVPANGTAKTNIYVKDGDIINIVGGAGRSTTYGDRIVQVTGGTVQFSVNGGSNGYFSNNDDGDNSKGKLEGSTLVYVGGNANIGTTEHVNAGDTLYGVSSGCVLGAGNGNQNANEAGQVDSSHIIIDGNAKILGSVYGGGNYGIVGNNSSSTTPITTDVITISNASLADLTSSNGVIISNGTRQAYLNNNNNTAAQGLTGTNSLPDDRSLWIFEQVGTNTYRVKNKATNRYITGNSTTNNNRYFTTSTNQNNAITFTITQNGNGYRVYYSTNNTYYMHFRDNNTFYGRAQNTTIYIYKWEEIVPETPSTDTGNTVVQIDILGGDVSQNVYGGSNNNNVYGSTLINMIGGSTVSKNEEQTGSTTYIGTVQGTIYGGSNTKGTVSENTVINLSGGTVGTLDEPNETDGVFGGGKGNQTTISGNTTVNITDNEKEYDLVINGSVYGGSEEGAVTGNSTISIKDDITTTQKVTLGNNVYGGGKGTSARAATTGGDVLVTVDGGSFDNDKSKIFGGCNVNGTIDGGITVNVGETTKTTAYQVYGGGNEANVTNVTNSVNVNIYKNSTVDSAFNGGNNAGIQGTQTQTPRKITVDGGTVGDVYGGSNSKGDLTETHVEVKNSATVNNVYGGGYGNETNINGPTDIIITDSTIKKTTDDGTTGNVYGGGYGGKVATNNGNTNITITGTTIENNVYGGGLGENASVARNTTVNISDDSSYHNVYGGGNKGLVSGNTTVSVDGTTGDNIYGGGCAAAVNGKTDVTVDNSTISNSIFGGGEGETAYVGTSGSPQSTTVVVKQTNGTTTAQYVYGGGDAGEVRGTTSVTVTGANITEDVFGGGNEAKVTSNATVLVEDSAKAKNIYGGGNAGDVGGKTTVNVKSSSEISENLYGGGNQGHVTGDVFVTVEDATVTENVYGGGNQGNVGGKTEVIVDTSTVSQSVYGGGNQGTVGSTTKVEIDDSTISNSVYGGGNQGHVNGAADVSVDNSTITNDIFGGGKAANVTGTTVEVLNGTTARYVYGGGDQGQVTTSGTNVTVADSTISQNIYGGGNGAPTGTGPGSVTGNVTLLVENTEVSGSVFGAGRGVSATTTGNTDVDVISSTIGIDVYGGGDNGIVIGSTDVNLDAAEITGSAYAAGNGENALVTKGTHIVAQNGTTIGASLFGGGNAAPTGPESDTVNTDVLAIVDVSGAIIGENVYGGANSSVIYGNTVVNIGTGAINEYYETNKGYTQSQIDIGGTIYGGGEQMDPTKPFNYDTISVEGNIDINVDGSGYDTDGIYIHGSIFGSGNASRAGIPISGTGSNKVYEENNGTVTIRNYGTIDNPKELISIQRTGETKIDNSALIVHGTTDSTSLHPEAYFTLNRIKKLTIKNGSTIYLRNGSNILEKFSSMYGPDDNEVPATVTVEDGEVKNSNTINRLYMYSGINLNVSPSESLESYGDVTGMTYFGIYKIDDSSGSIVKGIYDEEYSSSTIQWADRDYSSCYVSGLHYQPPTYEEHDIKKDGFYTTYEVYTVDGQPSFDPPDDATVSADNYASFNTYPYIEYITPTPEAEIYYMWYAGPNDNVFLYPMTLFASKFSTFSAKELNLLGISFKNATMRIEKVESDLTEGVGLYSRNEIPNVNLNPDEANNKFGLAMRTGNSGWSMNGYTEFKSVNNVGSYDGDIEYTIENSTTTPTLSFYLYHSNNITVEKELGYYRIVMKLSYWKDDLNKGRATVIIDLTMATMLYDDFGYNGAITPGRQYDLFASTETNITSKSSFSTYFELAEPNFSEKEKVAEYYEDSFRVITTQYAFPTNTTITMIDRSDNNNPKYYYYIVTAADYAAGKNSFRLDEFREMGSTDKYYNEKVERENYLIDSLDYEYESFIFTADFESAQFDPSSIGADHIICSGQEFRMYLNAEVEGHTETLFGLMDDQIDSMKYSIFDSESLIDIDANLTKNKVYHGNTTTLNVNTNYSITVVGGSRVYDTRYFDQKLGAKLTFFKEDDEGNMVQVSGSELLGTYFTINGENYYPRADGTTRIKLAEKVSNASSAIVIHTENSSLSGEYLIHIDSFGSADGVYYGINASDSAEVTLTIIDNIFGLDSHLPDAQTIIDMTTGHTLEEDTGYTSDSNNKLDFTVDYQSGLTKPVISVKLYRRNYDSVSTLDYSLVDMQDYVTETLENINTENEYSAISNSTISSAVSNPTATTTFNLRYTLKDNLVSGTYKVVFTLYDYDEVTQYEEVENPDGSTTLVELPDKLPVYNYIGDTFSYIVIK